MAIGKCSLCGSSISQVQYSHNVPCYLFFLESSNRKEREKCADIYGVELLCEKCHKEYELKLRNLFIDSAKELHKQIFKKEIIKPLNEDYILNCPNCNAEVDIEDIVCPYCNTKIKEGED